MNNGALELMWQEAENWRLFAAVVCGIIVGIVYFYSLRWSINHLSETSHKFRLFGLTALLRIALFFGVLILIGHRNIAVILLYVIAFFFTKAVILWREKGHLVQIDTTDEKDNKSDAS